MCFSQIEPSGLLTYPTVKPSGGKKRHIRKNKTKKHKNKTKKNSKRKITRKYRN